MENTKYNKLVIFDLDGTLLDTPLPDVGKKIWEEKTGNKWPHRGWWGRADSLDIDVFDMPTIETTMVGYKEVIAEENTLTVMMTGRLVKLKKEVNKLLEKHNLVFDLHRFNTGGETFRVKQKQILAILNQYPEIDVIEIWEDRPEHIVRFRDLSDDWVTNGVIKSFTINIVDSEHFEK